MTEQTFPLYQTELRGHHLLEILTLFSPITPKKRNNRRQAFLDLVYLFNGKSTLNEAKRVIEYLKNNPEELYITPTETIDCLCLPCIERRDECSSERASIRDRKAIAALSLKSGKIYSGLELLRDFIGEDNGASKILSYCNAGCSE